MISTIWGYLNKQKVCCYGNTTYQYNPCKTERAILTCQTGRSCWIWAILSGSSAYLSIGRYAHAHCRREVVFLNLRPGTGNWCLKSESNFKGVNVCWILAIFNPSKLAKRTFHKFLHSLSAGVIFPPTPYLLGKER